MIWNYHFSKRFISTQNNMALFLTLSVKPSFFQGFASLLPWNLRQFTHITRLTVSTRSSGMARPSSWRTPRYNSISSWILAIASSFVFPWLTQGGKLGHWATQSPSSPGLTMLVLCVIGWWKLICSYSNNESAIISGRLNIISTELLKLLAGGKFFSRKFVSQAIAHFRFIRVAQKTKKVKTKM